MSHRKCRETKQQPSRSRSVHQLSHCLVSLHFLCDILSGGPVFPSPQDVNVDVDWVEPEGSALDAGGVGGLVEDPRELKVPGDVVGEGEDHGERDETSLQLVELPGMEGGKGKLIRIPHKQT